MEIVKTISFIAILGFTIAFVVIWFRLLKIRAKENEKWENHFKRESSVVQSPEKERWDRIVQHFQSQNQAEWRVAILDADSLLETMIDALGYYGETFGEKLKSMNKGDHPWLQAAWDVHSLRNRLAHEGSNFHLDQREAYHAFKTYEYIFHANNFLS